MTTIAWVALGAFVGAPARYACSRALNHLRGFPWGTLLVNLSGAFVLGWVSSSTGDGRSGPQVGVIAFCGAFTTYSAFALESVELDRVLGIAYTVVSVAGGLLAAAAGWAVGAR